MNKKGKSMMVIVLAAIVFVNISGVVDVSAAAPSLDSDVVITDDGKDFNIEQAKAGTTPQGGRIVSVSIDGTSVSKQNGIYAVKESNAEIKISANLDHFYGTKYSLANINEVGKCFGLDTGTLNEGKIVILANDFNGKSVYVSPVIDLRQIVDRPASIHLSTKVVDAGVSIHVYAVYGVSFIHHYDWSGTQKAEMAAAGLCSPLGLGAAIYAATHSKEPVYHFTGVLEASHYSILTDDASSTVISNLSNSSADESELVRTTKTLENNAITTTGFEVKSQNPRNSVSIYRDGYLVSGMTQTVPGYYTIVVNGSLNDTYTKHIEIVDIEQIRESAKHIVTSEPVLSEEQILKVLYGGDLAEETLCYEVGSEMNFSHFPAVSDITVVRDGEVVSAEAPLVAGSYTVSVTIGKQSGDILTIKSNFEAIDTSAQRTFNQIALDCYASGLQTALEGYAVSLDTQGSGDILVFTESYAKALEISLTNEYNKTELLAREHIGEVSIGLFEQHQMDAINARLAIQHVFLPSRGVSIEDEGELYELQKLTLDHDVYVTLEEFSGNHLIFSQAYAKLNDDGKIYTGMTDFMFLDVSGTYNVSDTVLLLTERGNYSLDYGRSLFEQMDALELSSGQYSVIEVLNGHSHTYTMDYYARNELPAAALKTDDGTIVVSNPIVQVGVPYTVKTDEHSIVTIRTDNGFEKTFVGESPSFTCGSSVSILGLNGQTVRFEVVFEAQIADESVPNSPNVVEVMQDNAINDVTEPRELVVTPVTDTTTGNSDESELGESAHVAAGVAVFTVFLSLAIVGIRRLL